MCKEEYKFIQAFCGVTPGGLIKFTDISLEISTSIFRV